MHSTAWSSEGSFTVPRRTARWRWTLPANVLPVVEKLRSAGTTSLEGIARALNERGVRTARGGQWHASSVRNLLLRADA